MRNIPWWNVDVGSAAEDAVMQAVQNRRLSMGVLVERFEAQVAKLLQVPHVVAVNNGTSALMLAMLEAGVGKGDEVIVPNRTWIATAHAAHLLGAKVVLADVESSRPVLDPAAFAAAITSRTRCVVPVHLNGRACNMPAIRDICAKHGVIVLEDAAQALLSASPEGGYLGTHSRSGCFSLSVAKLITSGQGGFVVTHDSEVARRLRLMRTHGTDDVVHAHWHVAGGNFRFTDILAALALTQLETIFQRKKRLLALYATYNVALRAVPHVKLLPIATTAGEVPLYIEVVVQNRGKFMEYLLVNGIQSRPLYPNLHDAPQFACYAKGNFLNSMIYAENAVFLPSGPDQNAEDIAFVIKVIQGWNGA